MHKYIDVSNEPKDFRLIHAGWCGRLSRGKHLEDIEQQAYDKAREEYDKLLERREKEYHEEIQRKNRNRAKRKRN